MSDISQLASWHFYEQHFASARMSHYLTEFSGDEVRAIALYNWNVEVSSAIWELLSYVEIALRNTIDNRMRTLANQDDPHWLFEISSTPNNSYVNKEISQASERVLKNGKMLSPAQLISELPFGFWVSLISRRHRNIWPNLASGFSGMKSRNPSELQAVLRRVRDLRNRIGHHHRVWSLDLVANHSDLMQLANFISPEFGRWLFSLSRVPKILDRRPY
jgi:Abi-like protein